MLQYEQKAAKKAAKWKILRGLSDDELTHLEFSKEEANRLLKWKHDKEFEFDGIMYDIVRIEESADSVNYYCWADTDETLIVHKIKSLLGEKNQKEKKDFSRMLNLFLAGLYLPEEAHDFAPEYKNPNYYLSEFNCLDHTLKPVTPPPKSFF